MKGKSWLSPLVRWKIVLKRKGPREQIINLLHYILLPCSDFGEPFKISLEQLQQIYLSLSPFHFFSILGIDVEKTYSSRLIFHLPFSFIFSQSPIISLQSLIERGDITSPFSYRKWKKLICWSTSSIYIEIEKGDFPIWWEREKGKINLLDDLK